MESDSTEQGARAVPSGNLSHPEDLPKLKIPFEDMVVELLAPKDDCPACDADDDSFFLLRPEIRALRLMSRWLST